MTPFRKKVGVVALLLHVVLAASLDAQQVRRCPKGLAAGDTIMLVAPAGPVTTETIQRVERHLRSLGYQVRVPSNLNRQRGYLSGTDQQRAEELMSAILDDDVDAVFPMTGGYGTSRVLDRLDFDKIRDLGRPKTLIGFSDITGLHLAFAAETDWITFHSPNPDGLWGSDRTPTPYTTRGLWRCLQAKQRTGHGFDYDVPSGANPLRIVQHGRARGLLTGGNLSLVTALMGTPYEIETEGRVVFLEDVHEAPYRVDRYLSQLRLAGKLDAPAAVILGQFTDAAPDAGKSTLTLQQVFDDYFSNAAYPVVANFPAGHHRHNVTLPLGATFDVDTKNRAVRVVDF